MSAWTSDLSVGEFAALRGVGLEPVGQVMGSTVYQIGYSGGGGCGAYGWPTSSGPPRVVGTGQRSSSSWTGYPQLVDALTGARRRAVSRLVAECTQLGGDGVVGLDLRFDRFPGVVGGHEIVAIGTAVRARSRTRPRQPFLADLPGQEVARLLRAGWVPCGLVVGVAVCVRHDDLATVNALASWRNTEVRGLSDLVHETRVQVRAQARADALRQGGEGLVLREMTLHVSEQECASRGGRDHVAQATLIGTALARLDRTADDPSLPVLHLDEAHRQVVGRRLVRRTEEFG